MIQNTCHKLYITKESGIFKTAYKIGITELMNSKPLLSIRYKIMPICNHVSLSLQL